MNRRSFFKGLAALVAVAAVVPKQLVSFVSDVEPIPGWLPCDGRMLSRWDYPELFKVLGDMYGGDAIEGSFCLPDMRGSFLRLKSPPIAKSSIETMTPVQHVISIATHSGMPIGLMMAIPYGFSTKAGDLAVRPSPTA